MQKSHQSPSLPVLPIAPRRLPARRATLALMVGEVARQPAPQRIARTKATGAVDSYNHLGIALLCFVAVAMVGTLVMFSIVRDQAALNRPEPVITTPLHP